MKKILILFPIIIFLVGCGQKKSEAETAYDLNTSCQPPYVNKPSETAKCEELYRINQLQEAGTKAKYQLEVEEAKK